MKDQSPGLQRFNLLRYKIYYRGGRWLLVNFFVQKIPKNPLNHSANMNIEHKPFIACSVSCKLALTCQNHIYIDLISDSIRQKSKSNLNVKIFPHQKLNLTLIYVINNSQYLNNDFLFDQSLFLGHTT